MKISYVFSGQGCQQKGMLIEYLKKYNFARSYIDRASTLVGRDLEKIIYTGGIIDFNNTKNAQILILLSSIIGFDLLEKEGISPDIVTGFSLGEFSAMYACGMLSFDQVITLVNARSKAMDEAIKDGKGSMVAIKTNNVEIIEQIAQKTNTQIANYNSLNQVVISGLEKDIDEAILILNEKSIRNVRLNVSSAFHSKYMSGVESILEEEFSKIQVSIPRIPIISNYDAKVSLDKNEIINKAIKQVDNPVIWDKTMQVLKELSISKFIEIGYKDTLVKLIVNHNKAPVAKKMDTPSDLPIIKEWIG